MTEDLKVRLKIFLLKVNYLTNFCLSQQINDLQKSMLFTDFAPQKQKRKGMLISSNSFVRVSIEQGFNSTHDAQTDVSSGHGITR